VRKLLGFILFFLSVGLLFAQTVYVKNPEVMMLNAPQASATILTKLDKKTPVELLKTDKQKGFSFVQTSKGEKGWIQTKFLSSVKPARSNFLVRWWHKMVGTSAKKASPPATSSVIIQKPVTEHSRLYANAVAQAQNTQSILALENQVKQLQHQVSFLTQRVQQLKQQQNQNWWRLISIIIIILGLVLLIWLVRMLYGRQQTRWFK